ncbi:cytochrome P450 [Melanomma pulvis-pyrius CBS 109.77]|uniref:Cytochrome P450 n=1 Tax=Melanomma pulvis-pyrius CBS 109.77 TaxID=1314802 RepID=A0A6A6XSK3_9PLEO|nr:cytochrome P450 [Melanomma pulvis-pyrius CBS 109.77]
MLIMFKFEHIETVQWTKFLFIFVFSWILYVLARAIYNISLHPLNSYPGPIFARATPLPMVWHLLCRDQVDWLMKCHKTYGNVVRVAPGELSYITSEAWRDIYSQDSLSAGRKWEGLYRRDNPQFQSMQGADDQTHIELRRIFNPAFAEKNLRDQEPMFKRIANQAIDRIKRCQKESPTEGIDMTRFFLYVTCDIIGDFTLAQPFGMLESMQYLGWMSAQGDNLSATLFLSSSAYLTLLKPLASLFVWVFRENFNAPLLFATEQVKMRMKREAPGQGSDIWAWTFRENKFDRKLTPREMYTNAMLFFLAGTETSAASLTSLLWYLHINPTVSSTLTHEIRNAFTSLDEITLQRCSELPYMQACIEEVLRLDGPVKIGLPRVTPPKGMVIDGNFVPGETVVYVAMHSANLSARNFQHPEKFIPERWMSDDYASDKKGARQPFSLGARNCLGKSFAYHEMRLLIATLLFSFDIKVRKESEAWGMNVTPNILTEKRPLWVDFMARN